MGPRAGEAGDFSVGFSGDGEAAECLLGGGEVWFSVTAGLFPDRCAELYAAARAGDAEGARALARSLEPLHALYKPSGSLRAIYAAAGAAGLCRHAPPLPLLPLEAEAATEVKAALEKCGFLI